MNAKLAIIGGGASGIFAAALSARRHRACVLFERKARIGSKMLMTANGRCNFTKDISAEQFLRDLAVPGSDISFVREAIKDCPPRNIIGWFKSLNVPLRRMADGRMFPADGKAATIVHCFGDLLRDLEVPLITNCAVSEVKRLERGFEIITRNFSMRADNVLLATGGVSYPKTGSVGDGQKFAASLGHHIVSYQSGLIGLETNDHRIISLAGHRFEDGRAKIFDGERTLFDYSGEVDCERFGLSGAAVYNAQRFLAHYERVNGRKARELEIEVWFNRSRIRFKGLRFRPIKEAIVTIGGVDTREIDPRTMESKIVPGLYFAGEVMDIDGPTGGYNLTLAFATASKAINALG